MGEEDEYRGTHGRLAKLRLLLRGDFLPTLASALPLSLLLTLSSTSVDARALQAPRALRLLRAVSLFRSDPVAHQQPSNMEELLIAVRASVFDLQASNST